MKNKVIEIAENEKFGKISMKQKPFIRNKQQLWCPQLDQANNLLISETKNGYY